MIEKLIVLEDIDPVIFYGVNNANIQLIKALYPKLRIVAVSYTHLIVEHELSSLWHGELKKGPSTRSGRKRFTEVS